MASPRDDRDSDLFAGTAYRLVRVIGMGGSACLYEVEHVRFSRRFAAKVLRETLAADGRARERMKIEADAAARIRHPHLVDTVDFDWTGDGRPFLVMELLQGTDLRAELGRVGRFPLTEAVRIVRQVADGIAAAHAAGVVHRDLKPENVFFHQLPNVPPVVKVLDLGLAKMADSGQSVGTEERLYPTEHNMFVGTPEYVAPEQILGSGVDARADVYGMGVLLFELLTGTRPFADAADPAEACLTRDPDPPSKWRPEVPRVLDDIVLRALRRDPDERFQTARELDRALLRAEKWLGRPRLDLRIAAFLALVTMAITFFTLRALWAFWRSP